MTDRPILFSGPMIRALLDGRKTQTRRVLPVQPSADEVRSYRIGGAVCDPVAFPERPYVWLRGDDGSPALPMVNPPRYLPGDRLWVKEKHAICERCGYADPCEDANHAGVGDLRCCRACDEVLPKRKRPSIFMPKAASRLTLTVTDVRVQRLQEIDEADAIAEGCRPFFDDDNPLELTGPNGTAHQMAPLRGPLDAFHRLWDSLNADRAPWASNPWVVALTFTVHRSNIDRMEAA